MQSKQKSQHSAQQESAQLAHEERDSAFAAAATLSHLPTYNLIRIGRIIDRGVARIAQKVGVGPPELRLLFLISRLKACTLTEAIRHTTINHGNTSRVAAKLLEDGLLERVPDDEDRRKKRLRVTEQGNAIVQRAYPYRVLLDRQILGGFSRKDREALEGFLKRISTTVYQPDFMDDLESQFDELH